MSNHPRTNVRLVKCPKCAKILPEPKQVPLYACGGCNTILQAKYYRKDNDARALSLHGGDNTQNSGISSAPDGRGSYTPCQSSSSSIQESPDLTQERNLHQEDVVQNHGIAHGPAGRESDGTCQRSSFTDQDSPDQAEERDPSALSPHDSFQRLSSVDREPPSLSEERNQSLQTEDRVQNNGISHAPDGGESDGSCQTSTSTNQELLDPIEERHQSALVHSDNMKVEIMSFGTLFSGVPSFLSNKEDGETNDETDQINPSDGVVDQNLEQMGVVIACKEVSLAEPSVEDCNHKKIAEFDSAGGSSMHNESQMLENTDQLGTADGPKQYEKDELEQSRDYPLDDHKQNTSREASTLVDECLGIHNKELQKLAPENGAVGLIDKKQEQNSFAGCISEKLEGLKLVEDPLSTESTQVGHRDSTVCLEIGGSELFSPPSSPKDMMTTRGVISTDVSCLSENAKSTEKVETVRNSLKVGPRSLTKASFASEESICSFDEIDDQVPGKQVHHSEETLPENDAVLDYVGSEESPEWNGLSSRNAYGNPAKNYSMSKEEASTEENPFPFENRSGPNSHGFSPRVSPLYQSSDMAYETGSSSSYVHDEPHMRHHPYNYERSEKWHRNAHIHRGNLGRRRLPEAVWREHEFLPMYYNYDTSGEIYQRSRYNDRRRRSESWSQNGSLPPLPAYSGEMFNGRYQIPYPYMYSRHPDDLRWSAQLPPAAVCCQEGLYISPSREISWDLYDSYQTSPRHPMDPNTHPWLSQDTIFSSDERRYKDQMMRRLFLREKRQALKRRLQPVAGGAPFITCCFCFKVLQLPEIFFQPRRRRRRLTQKLKCGSCSNILEFSLENESNSIPEEAKGLDAEGGEMLSDSSFRVSGREKRECESFNEEETYNAGESSAQGRQMKVTWQLPPRTTSPLHRLMGYSSPHDLLNECLED